MGTLGVEDPSPESDPLGSGDDAGDVRELSSSKVWVRSNVKVPESRCCSKDASGAEELGVWVP
jgi:hypothetical protein